MNSTLSTAGALSAGLLALAGCASGPAIVPPAVPATLQPPAGQVAFLEALATGVQIYECVAKADAPDGYAWAFRAPEASLMDPKVRSVGKHFVGPTWQGTDGSAVLGEVVARDPGPDTGAIPWLLLAAKSTSGSGIFSETKFIQRVKTAGGTMPEWRCGAGNAGEVARVPYTATYYFYRAKS